MMGTLEFTSATYYRYMGLNVDMLNDKEHLGALTPADVRKVVDAFLRACLTAVPNARKNSMNAHTLPGYVLGLARKGQPLQLANAFESPVRAKSGGLLAPSVESLRTHFEVMKSTWGIETTDKVELPSENAEKKLGLNAILFT
jgi:CRISPR system Cascade subunit CasC